MIHKAGILEKIGDDPSYGDDDPSYGDDDPSYGDSL